MVNTYSQTWFKLFLETQPYTEQETAFIIRQLPPPFYRRILDLCCGQGRHTSLLAAASYEMVGLDSDEAALDKARRNTTQGQATYLQKDMRHLEEVPGQFEAILSLWQSFGYFDEETNQDILRQISQKLKPKGQFILDIYQRDFFEAHQGSRQIEREGLIITSTNRMSGNRLTAELDYGDSRDTFEWQLYMSDEICHLAAEFSLACRLICTDYDEQKPVSIDKPRMQLVFERKGNL